MKEPSEIIEELKYMLAAYDKTDTNPIKDIEFLQRMKFIYATGAMSEEVFEIISDILTGGPNSKRAQRSSPGGCSTNSAGGRC